MIELTTTETKLLCDSNLFNLKCDVKLVKVKVAPDCIQSMIQYSEYTRILLNGVHVDVKETIAEIEALINKNSINKPKLKLEVGKTYRDRRGNEIKIIDYDIEESATYPFVDREGENYMEDGRFDSSVESHYDLIEEVLD